jgi:hypothetical protein
MNATSFLTIKVYFFAPGHVSNMIKNYPNATLAPDWDLIEEICTTLQAITSKNTTTSNHPSNTLKATKMIMPNLLTSH